MIKTYLEAVNDGLRQILETIPESYILGEDVGTYGGGFGATKGLIADFPDRVLDTPISEAAITGVATGSALLGKRPILEIQFSDFLTVAVDQLVNEAAKIHFLSNGKQSVPIVIRAASGAGTGAGAQHSQSLENWFAHIPGLIVAMPSNAYDAKGILVAAVKNNNPVMIFEPKSLYQVTAKVPRELYEVALGQAKVVKTGTDLTIIALGCMVEIAKSVAEKTELSIEIVDPITISPLDIAILLTSAQKTRKVLIVTEAVAQSGISGEILAQLVENGFTGKIKRLGGKFMPISAAKAIESEQIPSEEAILQVIEELLK
ncbi:TPP-dependent acetoin dehydrogenase complex, E1 protein subunit beta [Lactococcus hodotermopsidis]|uniref:TPP-dependent acetoin dehydrogenase complex, E1 protein subunit beta n=1 Tax=Pseudolactococcus hodotermopsidis TaxID=2709157 RepID=A0A6A0BAG4_9LACT|nr:transketolase C-terminal domain-containing protein [Lactococcus hodotermopsidis]GFH41786.1 TPP-dependent acetoin dehydrogenase complex, E1 protein subunit beta [Lactococcus hodotermopsidis]